MILKRLLTMVLHSVHTCPAMPGNATVPQSSLLGQGTHMHRRPRSLQVPPRQGRRRGLTA